MQSKPSSGINVWSDVFHWGVISHRFVIDLTFVGTEFVLSVKFYHCGFSCQCTCGVKICGWKRLGITFTQLVVVVVVDVHTSLHSIFPHFPTKRLQLTILWILVSFVFRPLLNQSVSPLCNWCLRCFFLINIIRGLSSVGSSVNG